MKTKKYIRNIHLRINYILSYQYISKVYDLNYHIMSIEETLDYISTPGNSMLRIGDGEVDIMNGGGSENYQKKDDELRKLLLKTVNEPIDNLLICLPDTLCSLDDMVAFSKMHWVNNFRRNYETYKKIKIENYRYGNAFVSRPYMIYKDKSKSKEYFERIKSIFENRDLLIVEGKYSRNGVGNDLLQKAKSVKRILCPNINSFSKYNDIKKEVINEGNNKLVLLSIGPTAKVLCRELHMMGFWTLDIGHIDSEYEWYLKGTDSRFLLTNKHTAERKDSNIGDCDDSDYIKSIIFVIE